MEKDVLKKFGRYFLLDLIAQGGMAEIYRSRFASMDGAGRFLVIKRIQPSYGGNAEFLQMFKSEIKVMLGFNHPNIVQLYDFGEEHRQPYIAMEFVDGRNLRQIISRTIERKITLPVELAAYIISQAASGLHYAHTFKDKISGESLNIIHRDISPQNVLISYEGVVKVIDFGIAKAATNSEATRAGVIKGKPSYLSPEQITGEVLDSRSDVFSLGAVLWELLAGKKLFTGENDLAILKLIESCQTYVKPPSSVNPKVPKELDYIVLKSLTKQREKRFQTADELQRALHKFLYSFSEDFNPNDLSYFLKDLFRNEIVEDRKRLQQLNQSAEKLLSTNSGGTIEHFHADREKDDDGSDTMTMRSIPQAKPTGAREIEGEQGLRPNQKVAIEPSAPQWTRGVNPKNWSGKFPRPFDFTAKTAAPRQKLGKKGPSTSIMAVLAVVVAAVLFLPEVFPQLPLCSIPYVSEFLCQGDDSGRVVIEGDWKDATVLFDNQVVGKGLPLTVKKVPIGKRIRMLVKGPIDSFETEILLAKSESKVVKVPNTREFAEGPKKDEIKKPEPVKTDPARAIATQMILLHLNIFPNGSSGSILLNGKPVEMNSPHADVPMDAPLELVVERSGFAPFRREFAVSSQEWAGQKEMSMDVQLRPLSAGRLTLLSTPSSEVTIMIDGKPWVRKTPITDEILPAGTYPVRMRNIVLGMKKDVTIVIEPEKILKMDVRLELE